MLPIILGILLTLFVFSLIVFIHELGHFMTARLTGMKVEEFGMGLPPRVRTLFTDKKGTVWTLNALPIWGFVRIKGEDVFAEWWKDSDSFASKPWWARSLVLLAGVTMNFLLAYVVFVGVFLTGATPIAPNTIIDTSARSFFLPSFEQALATGFITESGGLVISSVSGSIAERAGIGQYEKMNSINNTIVSDYPSFRKEVAKWGSIVLNLTSSGGTARVVIVTPENWKIGVYVGYDGLEIHRDRKQSFPLGESLKKWWQELVAMWIFTWDALADMVRKLIFPKIPEERKQATDMVSWPIGIGKVFVSVIEYSVPFSTVLVLIALISFNLWFFNLLPIPALDGGRWFTTTLSSIVSLLSIKWQLAWQKVEKYIHGFWFLFLLALSVVVAMIDIGRFF